MKAVGVAAELKGRAPRAIVVCSMGDGTTQQGEFLEVVAEAVREQLPVLFLVDDNRWSISTPTTGRTFFSRPDGPAREFYGLAVQTIDGRELPDDINTGTFGERSSGLLANLEARALRFHPDAVLVLIGMNDAVMGPNERRAFRENLLETVGRIRDAGAFAPVTI